MIKVVKKILEKINLIPDAAVRNINNFDGYILLASS